MPYVSDEWLRSLADKLGAPLADFVWRGVLDLARAHGGLSDQASYNARLREVSELGHNQLHEAQAMVFDALTEGGEHRCQSAAGGRYLWVTAKEGRVEITRSDDVGVGEQGAVEVVGFLSPGSTPEDMRAALSAMLDHIDEEFERYDMHRLQIALGEAGTEEQ